MAGLDQLVNKYLKRCFSCNRLKPLFLFKINTRKYQLLSDKGRCVDCRLCNVKRFIKQNGSILKYNATTNRYDTVEYEVSLLNTLKIYFR